MSRQVTVKFCGMKGTGKTATEAKKDAQRRIEAVLAGSWTPYYLQHHDTKAIVARVPSESDRQWGYRIMRETDQHSDLYIDNNYTTRELAIEAAAYHLAQIAATYVGLEKLLTAGRKDELDRYFAWQAEYAKARAEGQADQQCRDRADKVLNGFASGVPS